MAKQPVLTPQADDFPRWYQDVVAKAELGDNGPARGTQVIRPYGFAIWERMVAAIDERIKATGAQNVSFPSLIPQSYLTREADHVEGFAPELAVVTMGGGKELEEPLVVRPTSETIFGEYMAKWIGSWRDLPLLLNQWCNIVRWEMRTRVFLRSSEFLWQEGHTAHATREDAAAYAYTILRDVYEAFMVDDLAVPVLVGRKSPDERFPGAINTMTCEGMMGDGKALQMGTSHEFGQNFSTAFDIRFQDANGTEQLAWTTSWGASTRLMGGLIMAHGDDAGLRVPPRLAPTQVVILVVRDGDGVAERAHLLAEALRTSGVRVTVDDRTDVGFGRRATAWELKGVPVRIELGPRDLEEEQATVVRRDAEGKATRPLSGLPEHVVGLLDDIQDALREQARSRRVDNTAQVSSIAEAIEASRTGFAQLPARLIGEEELAALNAEAVSIRCLQTPDGDVAPSDDDPDNVATVGRSY